MFRLGEADREAAAEVWQDLCRAELVPERALQVLDQVRLVLDPSAEPHQAVGDADGGALLGAHLVIAHHRRLAR